MARYGGDRISGQLLPAVRVAYSRYCDVAVILLLGITCSLHSRPPSLLFALPLGLPSAIRIFHCGYQYLDIKNLMTITTDGQGYDQG